MGCSGRRLWGRRAGCIAAAFAALSAGGAARASVAAHARAGFQDNPSCSSTQANQASQDRADCGASLSGPATLSLTPCPGLSPQAPKTLCSQKFSFSLSVKGAKFCPAPSLTDVCVIPGQIVAGSLAPSSLSPRSHPKYLSPGGVPIGQLVTHQWSDSPGGPWTEHSMPQYLQVPDDPRTSRPPSTWVEDFFMLGTLSKNGSNVGFFTADLRVRVTIGKASTPPPARSKSGLQVLVSATPGELRLDDVPAGVDKPGGEPVTVTVRVKNGGAKTVQHVHVNDKLLIGYDDGDAVLPVVPLRQNGSPKPTGDLGSLAKGATTRPVTFSLLAKGDGGYSIEALATADQSGGGVVHGTGKSSVKVTSPYLSFETKADPKVNAGGALWAAGVPYTVDVKMQNLSYRKSIVFFPSFRFEANAQGGELIPMDAEIPAKAGAGDDSVCAPPAAQELRPRETRELKLVVYTSTAGAAITGATGGGTRSSVIVPPQRVWTVNDAGNDIDKLVPNDDIQTSGDSRIDTHLSDPGFIEYPSHFYDPALGFLYLSQGFVEGLGSFTYGIFHGLLVDLPTLAAKGLAAIPSFYLGYLQAESDLFDSLKDDPKLLDEAIYNPVTNLTLLSIQKAPAFASAASKFAQQVNSSVNAYFTGIANDWYSGHWDAAMTEAAKGGTETFLNVATFAPSVAPAIASCVLARSKVALKALQASTESRYAAAVEKIGSLDKLIPAGEALTKIKDLVPGMYLNYQELEKLYGLTVKQVDFLRTFAKENKLLITVRSRATQSIEWLGGKVADGVQWAGAVLKPEQIKLKSVSWLDTEVLGYNADDLGRVVMKRPISEAELRANLNAKGIAPTIVDASGNTVTNPTWQDAFKLLKQRVNEYLHARGGFEKGTGGYFKDLVEAAKQKTIKLRWNLADNSVDPTIAANGYTSYPFRLATSRGVPISPGEIDTFKGSMIPEFFVDGQWRCVTGDVDFLSMTNADGTPISAAKRVELYEQLAGGNPVHMLHPAADTWTQGGKYMFAAKANEFARAGVVPEFAPDGIVRAVEYDQRLSHWLSANDYRPVFDGSYLAPPQVRGQLPVPKK